MQREEITGKTGRVSSRFFVERIRAGCETNVYGRSFPRNIHPEMKRFLFGKPGIAGSLLARGVGELFPAEGGRRGADDLFAHPGEVISIDESGFRGDGFD